MLTDGLLVDELSQVISQATGPAFLLGAMAAFVSALNARLNRVADRHSALLATRETEETIAGHLEAHVSLTRRAKLLSKAIRHAVVSGIFTTCVVIVSFISAAFGLSHAYGAALLFVFALVFFAALSLAGSEDCNRRSRTPFYDRLRFIGVGCAVLAGSASPLAKRLLCDPLFHDPLNLREIWQSRTAEFLTERRP
jgi:hypothetical protein